MVTEQLTTDERRPGQRSRGAGQGRWTAAVPRVTAWVLTLVALLCALTAIGNVFSVGLQPVRSAVDAVVIPAPANLAYAAFLAVLAGALSRRKWIAHRALLILLGMQLVTVLLLATVVVLAVQANWFVDERGRPIEVADWVPWVIGANGVITVLAIAVLVRARGEFYGRAQRASVPKALGVFVALIAVFVPVGFGLVSVFPGSLHGTGNRLTWTVERVLGGAITLDVTRAGQAPGWVDLVLGLLGSAALFSALYVLFRSQRVASALGTDEEARIRELLAEQGERDSLGYFATRRDKAVVFSPTGKAAITYRVVAGVCLASGDPIGAPEAWPPVIERWLAMCREYTWSPAVMGASEEGAEAFVRAGLKALQLGDEAILDVGSFTLEGREMRSVRQAVNRVGRAGYTTRIRRHSEISADEMAEVARLAEQWRDSSTERGFSMALGRLGDPADGRCVLVEALDQDGQRAAILSFTPWGVRGLSLDLMRRGPDTDNGLVEFMIAQLARTAHRIGVDRISLNFAVFRAAFEQGARIGAGPVIRAWRALLVFFSRWWQLESLYRSNVKYQPRWIPRFVVFAERRELAQVGVASAIAEGFVSVPGRTTSPGVDEFARPELGPAEAEPGDADAAVEYYRHRPEQVRVRFDKLSALREADVEPYPVEVPRDSCCHDVVAAHADLPPDARTGERVSVAGRVMLVRDHGGVVFACLRDGSGDLQVMLTGTESGTASVRGWRERVDIGDHVSVHGEVVTSRHGEVSVLADSWTLAAKSLHPLPDKHRGLTDPEARVRHRYVDLIVRPQARAALRTRGAAVHALRGTLLGEDYLEVETPVLQPVHGGANARPFTTHINAYDMRLYLRIAPELYLKRLCVGGIERVFELGRTFRNEGVSHKHNPEFTMLEAYRAHADYVEMRRLCTELVQAAAIAAHGRAVAVREDAEIDLSGTWRSVTVHDAVSAALGEEITPDTPAERLRRCCERAGVAHDVDDGHDALLLAAYEQLVEKRTVEPTFYTDFPASESPLTRQHRDDARLAERWDLVAFGSELATGYSELVDPVEQRRRLTEQSWLAAGGDPEAMEVDEDFLAALEYAMPPTGGLGLGVDRLVMLLTGMSIRDTLPFPLVRPTQT